jgi:DnaK suppressor protein
MTKASADTFRKTLKTRQTELQAANKTQPIEVETASDDLDRIQLTTERDYAIGSLERNFIRLRAVTAALHRLDAGTFGICGNCEEEITPKRLAAVPWALLCIVCQEAADNETLASALEPEEASMSEA